jgi:hypothetical protein
MVPRALDSDSSHEPSIEWVAGASHSMVDRIGTHMLQRVVLHDSAVISWG